MDQSALKRTAITQKQKSKWFWAFWALVVVLVVSFSFAMIMANKPTKLTDTASKLQSSEATFDVTLNKQQINALAAHYLNESAPEGYHFRIDDHIMLYGSLNMLGQKLDMGMTFDPEVTKNGNIILKTKKLAIGRLPLPTKTVLSYVKASYDAPKYVTIQPNKQQIFINMSKLPVVQDMAFRAKVIDIQHDQFVFEGGVAK